VTAVCVDRQTGKSTALPEEIRKIFARASASVNAMHHSDVWKFLRPAYLKEARELFDSGQLDHAAFKKIEDQAVDEAIELQKRAGLDVITDGEMRRYAFYGHLIEAVEGYDKLGGWAIPFRNEEGEQVVQPRPVVVSRLRPKRHLCAEEFTYLRARTSLPAKTTLISAQQAAAYYDSKRSSGAYPTIDSYLADLVDILRAEVLRARQAWVHAFRSIPTIHRSPRFRDSRGYRARQRPGPAARSLDRDGVAIISGFTGVTFGHFHLCRGNNQSKFYAQGDYGPITRVFSNARFHRFLLEY
jgi:5-methyltetrahydropteroyltriglutamate--homocysteine methyltransferase